MTSQTYAEIMDQYNRLKLTKTYLDGEVKKIAEIYKRHSFIVYMGCGSSYSIAKSIAASTMTILGKKAIAVPAGDVLLRPDTYKKMFEGSLVVALSRSGTTSEILLAYKKLVDAGAKFELLSISCRTNQELAILSDFALEIPWAFDESVCQTSSVTNLYVAPLYYIATISGKKELKESLIKMVDIGEHFIRTNEQSWAKIAKQNWDCGVTLGDAEIGGICEEGALAFKEICQLPANYYPLLDSRHGPVVIINGKTLVIAAISDINSEFEKALINDLKKKNCFIVSVSDLPLDIEGTTNFCVGEKLQYPALGIPFINVAQMITYYKAKERNINPDAPTGLEAWIRL